VVNVSFPIKCMAPISVLELLPTSISCFSIYMNKAAQVSDPLERMKLIMASSISFMYPSKIYEKPLNPVLGETFQTIAGDGAKVFVE